MSSSILAGINAPKIQLKKYLILSLMHIIITHIRTDQKKNSRIHFVRFMSKKIWKDLHMSRSVSRVRRPPVYFWRRDAFPHRYSVYSENGRAVTRPSALLGTARAFSGFINKPVLILLKSSLWSSLRFGGQRRSWGHILYKYCYSLWIYFSK